MRSIPGIESGDFRAAVSTNPAGCLRVTLQGFADVDIRDSLATLFDRLHEVALEESVQEVELDFAGLEYLSSACIRPVLRWLRRLRDGGAQYGVSLVIRPESYWQRRSAHALEGFAPTVVRFDGTE